MPKCRHCGKEVHAAVFTCGDCQIARAESVMKRICDELCRWPRLCSGVALEDHCADCRIRDYIVNLAGGCVR